MGGCDVQLRQNVFERLRAEHAYTGGYTIREGLRAPVHAAPSGDVRTLRAVI